VSWFFFSYKEIMSFNKDNYEILFNFNLYIYIYIYICSPMWSLPVSPTPFLFVVGCVVGVVLLSSYAFAIWLLRWCSVVVVIAVFFSSSGFVFYCLYCLFVICLYCYVCYLFLLFCSVIVVASDLRSCFEVLLVLLLERVWLVDNALDSSHDLGSYAFDWNLLYLVVWTLEFPDVSDLLRSAGFKASCLPLLGYWIFIFVSHCDCIRMLMLERAWCLLTCSVGGWHLDFVAVLVVNPFAILKP